MIGKAIEKFKYSSYEGWLFELLFSFVADNKSNSLENKSSTSEASLPTDSTQQQTGYRRTSSAPATGFPMDPFDFSSMQNLLNVIALLLFLTNDFWCLTGTYVSCSTLSGILKLVILVN